MRVLRNRFTGFNAQEVSLISFRDLTTSAIGMLVGIIIMLAMMIAPSQKKAEEAAEKFAGNLRIELVWPDTSAADVDLWCKAPGDKPVGDSNKGGTILNLVRDDLGTYDDVTGKNYEIIFSRGNPPGEYICNVHWYADSKNERSVPVKMVVSYLKDSAPSTVAVRLIAETTLNAVGTEETMIRWTLDKDRNIVKTSVNSIQYKLRSAKE
jgi:hypothetical protein